MQKKGQIHESHNKVYNEYLCREIETLHWVLAQILTLKREYTTLLEPAGRIKEGNLSTDKIKRHRISLKE
jgi:hypothetical protein